MIALWLSHERFDYIKLFGHQCSDFMSKTSLRLMAMGFIY